MGHLSLIPKTIPHPAAGPAHLASKLFAAAAKEIRTLFLLISLLAVCSVTISVRAELAFQLLYEFPLAAPGPCWPSTRLVEASDGSFLGTSSRGGLNNFGAIYKVTPTGDCTTIFSFDATGGRYPNGGLVLGDDGNYYGTTASGGLNGVGTAFRMTPGGTLRTIFDFQATNGASPARLEPGSDRRFYGVTSGGGPYSAGTAFALDTNGVLTLLFSFNGTNGSSPGGGLATGGDGTVYGVTQYGGTGYSGPLNPVTGYGTIFSLTTNRNLGTLVFFNGTNGAQPWAPLTLARDGNLYGTTARGGANNQGTVFRLTPSGTLTTLYEFGPNGGVRPYGPVIQGRDGNLYGTTAYCVTSAGVTNGTVFSLTANGVVKTLVNLDGTNGLHPSSEMVLARDGNLYGTMADIAAQYSVNGGTLFRLVTPPVITANLGGSSSALITWTAFTNGVYQVERSSSATGAAWTPSASVTATSTVASFTEPVQAPLGCYYRVVLLP